MQGKRLWAGPQSRQVAYLLAVKLLLGPALMLAIAKALQLDAVRAMSLVLLTLTPTAQLAFVIAHQYKHGTEMVSLLQVVGTLLLIPALLLTLGLVRWLGLYEDLQLSSSGPPAAAGVPSAVSSGSGGG